MAGVDEAAGHDGLAAVVQGEFVLRQNPVEDAIIESTHNLHNALKRGEHESAACLLLLPLANVRTTGGLDFTQTDLVYRALEAGSDWVSTWRVFAWYQGSRSAWAEAVSAWERAIEMCVGGGDELSPEVRAYESLFTGRLDSTQRLEWGRDAALEKLNSA